MKKIVFTFFAASAIILTACNDNKTDSATNGTDSTGTRQAMSQEAREERNKQTALASIEGVNKHDPDMVLMNATADAMDYGDGSMKPTSNRDSIKASLRDWFAAFPDVKGENLRAVADGDWVMVWGDWSGTWKGDIMGQKATNKSFKLSDVDIMKFNDEGKIIEHHTVQSNMMTGMMVGMKMP